MEEKDGVRKGPWTEQEDVQLMFYVNLFGDRRWDFIAKVSGLKRTGKSCRLRWVNYLNPGLKRGKMTAHEERLVLELHSKWGNRWSRIARKLPGRTDNEIKNYWRTHMRKKAQERKKAIMSSPSSSSSSSSHSSSSSSTIPAVPIEPSSERSFYDTGGMQGLAGEKKIGVEVEESTKFYSLEEIWKDIELSEESYKFSSSCQPIMGSPIWDYCPTDSLWTMDEEDQGQMMLIQHPLGGDHCHSFPFHYNHMTG